MNYRALTLAFGFLAFSLQPLVAQHAPGQAGSTNVKLVAHVPLAAWISASDIEIEQELSRPYVYVAASARIRPASTSSASRTPSQGAGDLLLADRERRAAPGRRCAQPDVSQEQGPVLPRPALPVLPGRSGRGSRRHRLRRDRPAGHVEDQGSGADQGPAFPGGFHESYAYKHSNGQALLFTTDQRPVGAHVRHRQGRRRRTGTAGLGRKGSTHPETQAAAAGPGRPTGYHDFYVGYDPATHQDKFYGAGVGRLLRLRHHRPEESQAAHLGHRDRRRHPRPHLHRRSDRPLCRGRDRVPVCAAADLRSQARPRRHGEDHLPADRCVDRRLARPRRTTIEIRWPYVFVSALRGRTPGLQHDGSRPIPTPWATTTPATARTGRVGPRRDRCQRRLGRARSATPTA